MYTIKQPCEKNCPERTAECKKTCPRWAAYWQEKQEEYKRRERLSLKRQRPYD